MLLGDDYLCKISDHNRRSPNTHIKNKYFNEVNEQIISCNLTFYKNS